MQTKKLGLGETYVKFAYDNANGTTCVSAVIQLTGPITEKLVEQSLNLVQARHPLLRASFSTSGDSLLIDEKATELPLDILSRKDPEQWKQIYHQHLNEPAVTEKRYLWRATFLCNKKQDQAEHELIVSFHHTIIDGWSIGIFYRDLLNYARLILEGQTPKTDPLPLLPNTEVLQKKEVSAEQYFSENKNRIDELIKISDQLYSYEQNTPLLERTTRFLINDSGEEEMRRMLDKAREHNTTLTSLLSAALLLAVYKVKEDTDGKGRMQVCATPVNMRNNCDPIIGPDHIGPYISMFNTLHFTAQNTSVWKLAGSFKESSIKAIEEQSYAPKDFDRQLYTQMLSNMGKGPFSGRYILGAAVTNYGVIDLERTHGPFKIKHLYSGATRHAGDWLMLLHTATLNNSLSYCFCYEEPLLRAKNAESIVREFFALLKREISF